jgi:hypothetical protein
MIITGYIACVSKGFILSWVRIDYATGKDHATPEEHRPPFTGKKAIRQRKTQGFEKTMAGKVICLALLILRFSFGQEAASGDKRRYYNDAVNYFVQAREMTDGNRLHEAHRYYELALHAARISREFERLKESEYRRMNRIIRESRNEKFRLLEVTRNFQDIIGTKGIARGMSKEQVINSWGEPSDITKRIYRWEELEVWYYGNAIEDSEKQVHFKDGVVVDWKDKEKR